MFDAYGIDALSSAIAPNSRLAAIFVDAGGTIRSWNRGAEVLFGHTAAEAIGRRADLIVPEPLRDAHWSGFDRAVRSSWRGSAGWDPIAPQHRNGEPVAVEVLLLPIARTENALQGVLALFRPRSDDTPQS